MHSEASFPPSATSDSTAFIGLAAFLFSSYFACHYFPLNAMPQAALFILCVTAGIIFLADTRGRAASSGGFVGALSWSRSFTKLAGLLTTLAAIASLYWLFPEYHGAFYNHFYNMLRLVAPAWCILVLPYIAYTDMRMREPRDGCWHMGKVVMLQWSEVDRKIVLQHMLGWIIKGFFLPLMFTYFCNYLASFVRADFASVHSFKALYGFLYQFFYFIDVGLCCVGYMFALRLMDTHIRSAEPTASGWLVALICYEPFYSLLRAPYLSAIRGSVWGPWLAGNPTLYILWGSTILVLTAIYAWATVAFGARFSNLTHRGIITTGPYRFTKHPAYIAKNLSWWMISVPFITGDTAAQCLHRVLLMGLLSGIYFLRAKTEERHLMRDPVYAAYAESIRKYGIFRFLAIK